MKIRIYVITVAICVVVLGGMVAGLALTVALSDNKVLKMEASIYPDKEQIKVLKGRLELRENFLLEMKRAHRFKKYNVIGEILSDWELTKDNEKTIDKTK